MWSSWVEAADENENLGGENTVSRLPGISWLTSAWLSLYVFGSVAGADADELLDDVDELEEPVEDESLPESDFERALRLLAVDLSGGAFVLHGRAVQDFVSSDGATITRFFVVLCFGSHFAEREDAAVLVILTGGSVDSYMRAVRLCVSRGVKRFDEWAGES